MVILKMVWYERQIQWRDYNNAVNLNKRVLLDDRAYSHIGLEAGVVAEAMKV